MNSEERIRTEETICSHCKEKKWRRIVSTYNDTAKDWVMSDDRYLYDHRDYRSKRHDVRQCKFETEHKEYEMEIGFRLIDVTIKENCCYNCGWNEFDGGAPVCCYSEGKDDDYQSVGFNEGIQINRGKITIPTCNKWKSDIR